MLCLALKGPEFTKRLRSLELGLPQPCREQDTRPRRYKTLNGDFGTLPIYEYLCEACKTQIEVMQKYTDPAPTTCESCGNGPMVKQLSLSSFALKGTGWYVTDFKGKPKTAPSKDGESSVAPASTPSEAKGDAGSSSSAAKGEASQPASDKASSPSKSTPESSSGGKSETSLKSG